MNTRRELIALVAVVTVLVGNVTGAEKYALKLTKPEKVGDRAHISKVETLRTKSSVVDESGTAIEAEDKSEEVNMAYVETVLALDGTQVKKLSRKYEKAVKKVAGKAQTLELDGKTVICTRSGRFFDFALEGGGKLTDAALDLLHEEFKHKDETDDLEKLFLPADRVAVGESWKCNVKELVKAMLPEIGSEAIDIAKATGTGTLNKVYARDGANFGIIDIGLDLPLLSFGEAGDMIKADAGSVMKLRITLDVCIDGTQTLGTMTAKIDATIAGTIAAGDQKVTVKARITGSSTETQKPVK